MAPRRGSTTRDAERYRDVAETTLQQLDYAIRYLYRIRKHEIATALQQNRDRIAKRLR
jgi:hypothetical protein